MKSWAPASVKMFEIARAALYFVVIWITVHYVRGQLLEPLDDFFKGAGKFAGAAIASVLLFFRLYARKKERDSGAIAAGLWRFLPWFLGVALPVVVFILYFAHRADSGTLARVVDWLSFVIEFAIPVGALVFVYALLGVIARGMGKPDRQNEHDP